MSTIDPNALFFGNFLDGSSRLHDLERFREHANAFLDRERTYFEDEAHPDLEIEFLPLFAETFPPILHSSVIISTAILLEQEVRGFSNAVIEALGLKIRFNDLAGSIFERFRTLVTKVADLQVDLSDVRWDDTVGLFEIRNCLVHAHGQLSDFQRASTVRAFALRHDTPDCASTIMKVDAKTSQLALEIASDFLYGVYEAAIKRFPGQHGPLRGSRSSEHAASVALGVRQPMQLFDAHEVAYILGGLSGEAVRQREVDRALFSVAKAGHEGDRGYPGFQTWDGVAGAPLVAVLSALGELDGAAAFSFFSSRPHELGGLTPVEVLTGTTTHAGRVSNDAEAILAMPADKRLLGVVAAAEAFYADASA